ncbi:cysteine dioxygenase 1, cytosolic, isoform CRA_d [Mus musculus]|nr:cysteine dioxygenase 1, cytosolic, isoform CRA_d [Mus musculus]
MERTELLKPRTLADLIRILHELFAGDEVNVEEVQAVLEAYESNPAEWALYAKFDQYRYTRNLVDQGNGKFNLMILCWGEGHGSSIHDHTDSHCFLKLLQGNLKETLFDWPDPLNVFPWTERPPTICCPVTQLNKGYAQFYCKGCVLRKQTIP